MVTQLLEHLFVKAFFYHLYGLLANVVANVFVVRALEGYFGGKSAGVFYFTQKLFFPCITLWLLKLLIEMVFKLGARIFE